MFAKEVYARRRRTLVQKMREAGQNGIILFIGNAEAPAQYRGSFPLRINFRPSATLHR